MGVFSGEATMLYCPKCRQTYENGSQRFCSNDNSRLLPALSSTQGVGGRNVFANLLTRKAPPRNGTKVSQTATRNRPVRQPKRFTFELPDDARFVRKQEDRFQQIDPEEISLELELGEEEISRAAVNNKIAFEAENGFEIEIESPAEAEAATKAEKFAEPESAQIEERPQVRKVNLFDIPSSTAEVGDRRRNPLGRSAVTVENPQNLIGQVIKGRYKIASFSGEDAKYLIYLAEDLLTKDKKFVFRVFMKPNDDDLTGKILAEERISLSHINHPSVASLIDSGELQEGKPFIVTEYVEGESVRDILEESGAFDLRRAARIVRQAAYALSEVHQHGVLHRHLKPQNIILTQNDAGVEQIKVTDFAIADGWKTEKDFVYLAPEHFNEKPATFAGDIYSLGVIAFRMLTDRLPFEAESEDALRKEQKKGLKLKASELREDVPAAVDEVLEKALAFNPTDRYPKARDFGDAFFNALVEPFGEKNADGHVESAEDSKRIFIKAAAAEEDLPWEKRSPEAPRVGTRARMLFSILGLALLLGGLWAVWYYFLNRPATPPVVQIQQTPVEPTDASNAPTDAKNSGEIEAPPRARDILPPPNTMYFQNTREALQGDLAKNFRGFSFYYPNDWVKSPSPKNFVDVAKKDERGFPIEQMLVSYYESKGTFKADAEKFPELVKQSNERLGALLPNYRFVSESAGEINGGWKIYEMKFEAEMNDARRSEPLKIYGRRIFMPAMRQGARSGFVITMLVTSLSSEVTSVDEVGVKGGLKTLLDTFEPSQAF